MKLDDSEIEKIFKEGFGGFESNSEENDWKEMANLLDDEERGIIIFFRKLKTKFNPKTLTIITSVQNKF